MKTLARIGRGIMPLLAVVGACAEGSPPELAEPLVLAQAGGSNPTVALDATGTGYVAWVETVDDVSNVVLVKLGPDGPPVAPVRVNDVPGDAAPHLQAPPRVAVGAGGNVYVTWQNNMPIAGRMYPASNLRFARSTDGGRTFEPAVTVNDDAGGTPASHTFHDMIVTPAGDVVISWLDGRRSAVAEAAAMGEGATPAGPGVEPTTSHAAHVSSGVLGPDVRIAVSRDGGKSFAQVGIADLDACPCCRTDIAAGPDGALYVGWRKIFDGDVRDVVVSRSSDGGVTWDDPVRVHADNWVFPGCPHAGPSLTVGADGTLHVAWYTGKEGASGLFYARSEDGGRRFSEPIPLVARDAVAPSQVDLAAAPGGALWAMWEDRAGEVQRSLLSVGSPDPGAVREILGTNPSLAVGEGVALVGWLRGQQVMVSRSPKAP